MDTEFSNGQMVGSIKGIGSITKCMAAEFILGQMVKNILEIIFRIRNQAMEFSLGLMENSTQENGLKASSME